mgnify:CR=1 FL=1
MSTGRTFITVSGISIVSVMAGLGFMFITRYIDVMHTGWLVACAVMACVFGAVTWRLMLIKQDYYENRFFVNHKGAGVSEVRHLNSCKLEPSKLLHFLIRPTKYIEVHTFDLNHNRTVSLKGELMVLHNMLYLDGYCLGNCVELYQYIGKDVEVIVTDSHKCIIERNLKDCLVESVEVI